MNQIVTLSIAAATLFSQGLWAASADDLAIIQDAQHNFVGSHGGDPSQEIAVETALARNAANVNVALIDQIEGTLEKAEIRQVGLNNTAVVMQGFGDANQAYVDQEGDDNFAMVTQAGRANYVYQLLQMGNGNRATVDQQGSSNTVTVAQYNDNNILKLSQVDSYNTANVQQYGNTALTVTQSNPGGSSASENNLIVRAYTEPGASNNFQPINLTGAGNTTLSLCNGSAMYCGSVLSAN